MIWTVKQQNNVLKLESQLKTDFIDMKHNLWVVG